MSLVSFFEELLKKISVNVYLLQNMMLGYKTYKNPGHPWGLCMIQLDIFDTSTFLPPPYKYLSTVGKLKLW